MTQLIITTDDLHRLLGQTVAENAVLRQRIIELETQLAEAVPDDAPNANGVAKSATVT